MRMTQGNEENFKTLLGTIKEDLIEGKIWLILTQEDSML